MMPIYTDPIPALTTSQMIEVDRAMMEDYKIGLLQMMENAGRNLAHLARARFLDGDPRGRSVVVLAGTGGNGGGALVCARRLHNYGARVRLLLTRPDAQFAPVPAHQLAILRRMGAPAALADEADGGRGNGRPHHRRPDRLQPAGRAARRRRKPDRLGQPPARPHSGAGRPLRPGRDHRRGLRSAIRAAATMTLALPKVGLLAETAVAHVGEIYLADISVRPRSTPRPPCSLPSAPSSPPATLFVFVNGRRS
jgi:NAD(P)H-hydrate epimerase